MKLKFIAALFAAVCAVSVPLLSGCKASTSFMLNTDEAGNKYYVVNCSGFSGSLQGEYAIPAYYGEGENRAPVTKIAEGGFTGTSITKLTVPETVTEVGNMAFAYNYQLKSVVFEEGSKLEELSSGAFIGCTSLQSAQLPASLKIIRRSAFEKCENLAVVNLPDGLESIGAAAFQNCSSLEEVVFPDKLINIGRQAFYYAGLKKVVIPDSVRDTYESDGQTVIPAIGYAAFHSCTQLELAVVGNGITTITEGAFGYCTSLKTLYLPASLERVEGARYSDGNFICGHAFHNDAALSEIYYGGKAEQWQALKANINSQEVRLGDEVFNNSALLNAEPQFEVVYGG